MSLLYSDEIVLCGDVFFFKSKGPKYEYILKEVWALLTVL